MCKAPSKNDFLKDVESTVNVFLYVYSNVNVKFVFCILILSILSERL